MKTVVTLWSETMSKKKALNKNHLYKHDIEIDQPKTQLDFENKKIRDVRALYTYVYIFQVN